MSNVVTHQFEPRIAAREERRQANEALGGSFWKTVAEPVTNSDSSAKRKFRIPHSSGLIDRMLATRVGAVLDSSALKADIAGKYPKRVIRIEIVTSKSHRRQSGEVVVVDQAQGMSGTTLDAALNEIGGDKLVLSDDIPGRNLFGRGLSDFLRAHGMGRVWTYDGHELSTVEGRFGDGGRWQVKRETKSSPSPEDFDDTPLTCGDTGTAVRCVIENRKRCPIPDHPNIVERLGNFYMLRLIAADPNVQVRLVQFRSGPREIEEDVEYDFPLGQVIASFSKELAPPSGGVTSEALKVDFLLARSEHRLRGLDADRTARQNGLLVVDDLDAVYDLTFGDQEYERAEFLRHIYGVVRVNGLRRVLESYLNSPEFPTSPLRVDRDGFNEEHAFSRLLLGFIAKNLRPYYEKERQRLEDKHKSRYSAQTKKRIDDALKNLNRFFNEITGKTGNGKGPNGSASPVEPTGPVAFVPDNVRLVAGRPRYVQLLMRPAAVKDGAEMCAHASEGISIVPETEYIDIAACQKRTYSGWKSSYLSYRYQVNSEIVGKCGSVTVLVEGRGGKLFEATLTVENVLDEPEIVPPDTMEFRPGVSLGRPGRRNNLVLIINTDVIPLHHWIRIALIERVGDINLLDDRNEKCSQVDIKLGIQHQVSGQRIARVLIPWRGTGWNQRGAVEAKTKVAGPKPLIARRNMRLTEPDLQDGGFFREVKYTELDDKVPSQYAAGTITVNTQDMLNQDVFGKDQSTFDQSLASDPIARHRLASLLVEEAAFRAMEELMLDNQLHLPANREVASIHRQLDTYKFESARGVFRALGR